MQMASTNPDKEITTMWASQAEALDHFLSTTFAPVDFRIRDIWDNGEFMTGATVDLLIKGQVVETETFHGSSEDASFLFEGDAVRQATSYASAWVESQLYTFEERLGPYGLEWEREQDERRVGA